MSQSGWQPMNLKKEIIEVKFEDLKGKIIKCIELHKDDTESNDRIIFRISPDEAYKMYHNQSCCESVVIEDICGEIECLLNSPILIAEERIQNDVTKKEEECESGTWTFYEIATINGSVTIRWYGSSNGYYSESVDFKRI